MEEMVQMLRQERQTAKAARQGNSPMVQGRQGLAPGKGVGASANGDTQSGQHPVNSTR